MGSHTSSTATTSQRSNMEGRITELADLSRVVNEVRMISWQRCTRKFYVSVLRNAQGMQDTMAAASKLKTDRKRLLRRRSRLTSEWSLS